VSWRAAGFALVELMVALTLGLLLSLALIQVFLSAKDTYQSQTASAHLQEDARFVLNKLAQDIRMVGTFGCLGSVEDASDKGDFAAAFNAPIRWQPVSQRLTLITTVVDGLQGDPTWTVRTDCSLVATAYSQAKGSGEFSFPVHQQAYAYNAQRSDLTLNDRALVSNVSGFTVLFGVARTPSGTTVTRYVENPGNPALIRSVQITLTLSDPNGRVKDQSFSVVAALRNRLQ
jgi:type IV pilus assembly protein PilW